MKQIMAILLAAAMALSLAACASPGAPAPAQGTSSSAPQEDSKVITIGILTPLTGEVAVYGQAVKNAAQMAFDEINAKGGVAGKTFKLDIIDEKGDPTEAVNAYNILTTQKNIDFLLGDVTSKPTLAVAELAATDRIPMLTATASHPDVTSYGDNIFRACFLDPFQGGIMAKFASETLGAKKIAILYNTSDDYSAGIAQTCKNKAAELGLEVTAFEGYGADDKDFKTQLTKIQGSGAEALVLPDYYTKAALVAAQAREIGFNKPIIGPDGFDGIFDVVDPANIASINDLYFTNHYFVGDPDPKISSFIKNYTDKYGAAPNALAALAYDAAYITISAYETTAGSTDKEAVIAALKKTNYSGVTGNVSYGSNGDPVKSVSVIKIVDGKYELAAKVNP